MTWFTRSESAQHGAASMTRIRKIAFEEHCTAPGFAEYSRSFVRHIAPSLAAELGSRLVDFDELRLRAMDDAGIDYVILSQTAPGVQVEPDRAVALRKA